MNILAGGNGVGKVIGPVISPTVSPKVSPKVSPTFILKDTPTQTLTNIVTPNETPYQGLFPDKTGKMQGKATLALILIGFAIFLLVLAIIKEYGKHKIGTDTSTKGPRDTLDTTGTSPTTGEKLNPPRP